MLTIQNRATVIEEPSIYTVLHGGETRPQVDFDMANDDFNRILVDKLITSSTSVPNALILGRLLDSNVFKYALFNALNQRISRIPFDDEYFYTNLLRRQQQLNPNNPNNPDAGANGRNRQNHNVDDEQYHNADDDDQNVDDNFFNNHNNDHQYNLLNNLLLPPVLQQTTKQQIHIPSTDNDNRRTRLIRP